MAGIMCMHAYIYIYFHCFIYCRFFKDTEEHVNCKYKLWVDDEEWSPSNDEPLIEIFKLDEQGKQLIPQGKPNILAPEFDLKTDFGALATSIRGQKAQFPRYADYQWWEEWLEDAESKWNELATKWDWPLDALQRQQNVNERAQGNAGEVAQRENPVRNLRQRELTNKRMYSIKRKTQFDTKNRVSECINQFAVYKLHTKKGKWHIGQIKQVTQDGRVKLRQYEGEMNGVWKQMGARKANSLQMVPRGCILIIFEKFTKTNKLSNCVKEQIKKLK